MRSRIFIFIFFLFCVCIWLRVDRNPIVFKLQHGGKKRCLAIKVLPYGVNQFLLSYLHFGGQWGCVLSFSLLRIGVGTWKRGYNYIYIRTRQRASFNVWVCALTSHASFFQFQFQYLSANSPALVQWHFVCMCVCLCVCVSVSASHTSFTHSHTPNTLDYAVKPCPQPILHPVCSIITHSFIFVFSLCLSYSISIGCLPGQMCNLHLIIIIETCFASL